jgi:hypothetical protein
MTQEYKNIKGDRNIEGVRGRNESEKRMEKLGKGIK